MNKLTLKISALAIAASLIAGCADNAGQNETVGTLGGAAAGGLIGSQFGSGSGKLAATGLGVLLGGILGNKIGKSMDDQDRARALQAQQAAYSAPVGQQIVWNNPDNGHSGTITPTRDGRDASGRYCREFQTTVTIGGQQQPAYGTACQQPDGSWKVVQ
jgi:surface antigen